VPGTPATKGYRFRVKNLSESKLRQVYMEMCAIGFRIIGETFAALPTCDEGPICLHSTARPADRRPHTE
jgi:hypothetical protein